MEELIDPIVELLKILADSTRLKIIQFLRNGENTANNIQDAFNKGQSTISQQLKILIKAGILQVRRDGIKKFYKIKNPQIFNVISALNSYLSNSAREKIDDLATIDILDTLH